MTATTEPRTRPWLPEELAQVSGYACCYTARRGDRHALIHLPGGAAATAQALRAEGRVVIPPVMVRIEDAETQGID